MRKTDFTPKCNTNRSVFKNKLHSRLNMRRIVQNKKSKKQLYRTSENDWENIFNSLVTLLLNGKFVIRWKKSSVSGNGEISALCQIKLQCELSSSFVLQEKSCERKLLKCSTKNVYVWFEINKIKKYILCSLKRKYVIKLIFLAFHYRSFYLMTINWPVHKRIFCRGFLFFFCLPASLG